MVVVRVMGLPLMLVATAAAAVVVVVMYRHKEVPAAAPVEGRRLLGVS